MMKKIENKTCKIIGESPPFRQCQINAIQIKPDCKRGCI